MAFPLAVDARAVLLLPLGKLVVVEIQASNGGAGNNAADFGEEDKPKVSMGTELKLIRLDERIELIGCHGKPMVEEPKRVVEAKKQSALGVCESISTNFPRVVLFVAR